MLFMRETLCCYYVVFHTYYVTCVFAMRLYDVRILLWFMRFVLRVVFHYFYMCVLLCLLCCVFVCHCVVVVVEVTPRCGHVKVRSGPLRCSASTSPSWKTTNNAVAPAMRRHATSRGLVIILIDSRLDLPRTNQLPDTIPSY